MSVEPLVKSMVRWWEGAGRSQLAWGACAPRGAYAGALWVWGVWVVGMAVGLSLSRGSLANPLAWLMRQPASTWREIGTLMMGPGLALVAPCFAFDRLSGAVARRWIEHCFVTPACFACGYDLGGLRGVGAEQEGGAKVTCPECAEVWPPSDQAAGRGAPS